MAKKVLTLIKLQIPGGQANPAPPVGPALGQHGVNIMEFCKAFNAQTAQENGRITPVEITVYEDRSFDFITKTPPAAVLIKEALRIDKGSAEPNRNKVGRLSRDQVRSIAETKLKDLNDDAWTVVKNTPGVTGFVGAGSKPVPLSQGEVDRILKTGAATAERPRTTVEYSLGETVKVTSGPLSDFDGEIVDVNPDQQKLKVLVDIFERQVPVELGFDQVKKID